MTESTQKVSPLRQRMIEDMRIRKLEPKTQSGYIRAVRDFTVWFGRSPDRAGPEDARLFQLHLVDKGVSPISINAMQTGLRFFTVYGPRNRPDMMAYKVIDNLFSGMRAASSALSAERTRIDVIAKNIANAGHPLVGDPVDRDAKLPPFPIPFARQALHAGRLLQAIFDLDQQLIHFGRFEGGEAIFEHFGKAAQNLLDATRKDVDAANDHHVVGAAQHAAIEQHIANASIVLPDRTHQVARAVAPTRPAVRKGRSHKSLGGQLGAVPVAFHHRRSTHHYFTRHAIGQGYSVVVGHAHFDQILCNTD